jgi:hypothetical protein
MLAVREICAGNASSKYVPVCAGCFPRFADMGFEEKRAMHAKPRQLVYIN